MPPSSLNLTALPNPLTPYALLDPDIAYQTQIGSFILIGTLGASLVDCPIYCLGKFMLLPGIYLGSLIQHPQ